MILIVNEWNQRNEILEVDEFSRQFQRSMEYLRGLQRNGRKRHW